MQEERQHTFPVFIPQDSCALSASWALYSRNCNFCALCAGRPNLEILASSAHIARKIYNFASRALNSHLARTNLAVWIRGTCAVSLLACSTQLARTFLHITRTSRTFSRVTRAPRTYLAQFCMVGARSARNPQESSSLVDPGWVWGPTFFPWVHNWK